MEINIQKNTTIPTKASQVFSTAEDNQPAVTIKAFQGERELVQYNKQLGEFNLEGIPPARRGAPQIEVSFDIDANGIMHIKAADKATGKENKITIKSNSGLSEAEIEKMIREAEENAESDKQTRTLIEARNRAESSVHEFKRDLKEHGESLSEDEKTAITTAIESVESKLKEEDAEAITKSIDELYAAIGPLMEKKMAKENAPKDDPVVDAEFTETK